MTPRELVVKTLNHEPIPRVPRDLWLPAGEESIPAESLTEINIRYPSDIVRPDVTPTAHKKSHVKPGKGGDYTDAWGCVWSVAPGGAEPGELKFSPLAEADKIAAFLPPAELLERSRFAKVNKSCHATSRFVLAWSEVRPFDRLRFLRGEATLVDLARGTKNIRGLLTAIHESACKEIELWAETDVDGVVFRDDWGSPEGLLISGEMWRDLFRPLYRDYCKILHAKDKFVFFHSDGNIIDIFGDLIKAGVDAIHSQTHLMDVERLAKRYRGRVTFWGEMDRRKLKEPGTTDEFRKSVVAVRRALDFGAGGVIAQCAWEPGMDIRTIAAFFEQWLVPVPMRG
jgi:uroporphyrinogen decarboxylase